MRSNPRRAPRRNRKQNRNMLLLLIFAVLMVSLIIISPSEPTQSAFNVNAQGQLVARHESLVISEVMSSNSSAFPDENGKFTDWLELWNRGDTEIDLRDVTLSNRPDRAKFIFPTHILPPDDRVIVFCDKTNANDEGKPFHAKFKLSSIGTELYVFDTGGSVLRSLKIPTLNTNEVYALLEDESFQKVDYFSPGFPNTLQGHEEYILQYTVDIGDVVINELMPAPRSGLRDEDNELSDWIELRNLTDENYFLDNLALSDNADRPVKWVFPEGSFIPPQGYYIVFASGKDKLSDQGFPHTNFRLSAEGEVITLSTMQGQLLDRVQYSLVPADRSYGRTPGTEEWQIFDIGTPGEPNDESGASKAERYLLSLNKTGVYISELMSSNDSFPGIPGAEATDWVELYNSSNQPQDLSAFGLSDSLTWPRKWRFPQGTTIYPGEYKVLLLDKSPDPGTNAAALHVSYALKRKGGEEMTFSDAEGQILDRVILHEIPLNISYGRSQEGEGFFYYGTPTPGLPNNTGFVGFAQRPELSHPGGLYQDNVVLTITAPTDSRVRYTTDGSVPTLDNGTEYTDPIEITNTVALRMRTFTPGLQPSQPITANYIMKTYYTLPVIALTIEPDELWNTSTGMFAAGFYEDGRPIDLSAYKGIPFRNPTPVYRLHGKKRRQAYAEMFEQDDGRTVFSQGITMGIMGQYSLDMPQKSLKLVSKAGLGEKYFNAKIFEDRPFEQYKSLVLRVSGNDAVWTRMADGLQSRLINQIEDTTVINQAWKPVIVYINGQYWGHFNLRERVSRYFAAQHEGMALKDAGVLDMIEGDFKAYYGSNKEWRAMIAKIKTLDTKNSLEDMKYIEDNIDVDNLIDYIIIQMFFANTDSGNIRSYKVPGGKWRWILFDMDYGLFSSQNNGVRNMLNPKGHGSNDDMDNSLWIKLLENDQMFEKFLRRFGELFQFFTTERMLEQVEICYNLLKPEMRLHWDRWAGQNLKNIAFDLPQTPDGAMRYWEQRVERMRNVVRKRPRHCYVQVQDWFKLSNQQMLEYFGPKPPFPPESVLDKADLAIQ